MEAKARQAIERKNQKSERAGDLKEKDVKAASAIRVTHIKFDHKGEDKNLTDALNIRANFNNDLEHAGNGVGDGEWIEGIRNEPALYVSNQSVKIKARLMAPLGIESAIIEATGIAPAPYRIQSIKQKEVRFEHGISRPQYVEFSLDGHTSTSIKKVADFWQWKAKNIVLAGGKVVPGPVYLNRSGPHTVYTVLQFPKYPWYLMPKQHPWASALEFATARADTTGKGSISEAASVFTDFFHSGFALAYNSYGMGDPAFFKWPAFNLTDFMIHKNGQEVSCSDLASAIHLMINLVGGRSHFVDRRPFGYINTTAAVGGIKTNNPFYSAFRVNPLPIAGIDDLFKKNPSTGLYQRTHFVYHTWAELSGKVYDATLGPIKGMNRADFLSKIIDTSTSEEYLTAKRGENKRYEIRLK
ncbi:MAG: hypothetical protein QGG87_01650 [Nitrospinota bacterium]|nr:hypothetical protein [Nitrospinota bacterium]